MNGELNRLDDLFREGMEGQEEMPSPRVWNKIEEELDKKERRRPLLYFETYKKAAAVWIIGIISVSVFAGAYFLLYKKTSTTKKEITDSVIEKKQSNRALNTQPKENTTYHIPVNTDTKILNVDTVSEKHVQLTDDSKEQLFKKSPSNEAVANQPHVQKSVPFKNKTVVAGSHPINKSAVNIENNASAAVEATEDKPNLAPIALIQWKQHAFASIEESIVSNQPIPTKTPTALSASATTVNPTLQETTAQIPVLEKQKKKKIYFSVSPIALFQIGTIKSIEKTPIITGPMPPNPNPNTPSFREKISYEPANYKPSVGLLTGIHFGKSISIHTGVNIIPTYVEMEDTDAYAVQRPDGRIRYTLNSQLGNFYFDPKQGPRPNAGDITPIRNIHISYNYVQIPLFLHYYFGKNALQGFITLGGNISFLDELNMKGDMLQLREKHSIKDKETTLKVHFTNALIGGGIKWNITNRFSFILNPQYQLAITPFNTPRYTKAFQRNVSIQTGIQLNLHK